QRTALHVAARERVVTLTGDELWDVPYLYMTGHGNVHFSDEELRNLRRYLEQGGFLHADDNYGMNESFRREIARVFPDHPLVEVRSEEHTSELQSRSDLVCRLLLEKKKKTKERHLYTL